MVDVYYNMQNAIDIPTTINKLYAIKGWEI